MPPQKVLVEGRKQSTLRLVQVRGDILEVIEISFVFLCVLVSLSTSQVLQGVDRTGTTPYTPLGVPRVPHRCPVLSPSDKDSHPEA